MRNFVKFLAVAGVLGFAPTAHAQERERNNNMRSGDGIWRIELRDVEQFKAMSSGDDDGVSELHWVRVGLIGREGEYQTVTEHNPYLSINGASGRRGNTIDVRQEDTVGLLRFADNATDTYHMWVHTAEVTGGDIDGPMLRFQIKVDARELDCSFDRVCNRGSTSVVIYHASIPVPEQRYNTCNAQNTYRVTMVEGANMVLEPLNAASGRGADVRVRHETRGGHDLGFGARGVDSGVQLAMLNGRVCAAWTGG